MSKRKVVVELTEKEATELWHAAGQMVTEWEHYSSMHDYNAYMRGYEKLGAAIQEARGEVPHE